MIKKITSFLFILLLSVPGLLLAQHSCPTVTITGVTKLCQGTTTTITATGGTSYHWSTGATTSSIMVTPYQSITYTVSISSGACTKDTICTVIVDDMPVITVSNGGNMCPGGYVTLSEYGAINFSWSNGETNSSITISPPNSITFTVQASNGACSMDTTITILIDTMPNVKFKGDTSICKNANTIIYIIPGYGYTYLWSTGSTSDSITVKDTIPGFYTYYVTVTNGACSVDSARITVHVNNCIQGVEDYSDPIGIETFPNPASSQLSVILDNPSNQNGALAITDLLGRQVYSEVIPPNQSHFYLDVSSLAPAIYFLKLQTDKGITVKKFVKD